MRKIIGLLVAWSVFFFPMDASTGEKMRVVFINPGYSDADNPTGGFWMSVSSFMQAVSDSRKSNK